MIKNLSEQAEHANKILNQAVQQALSRKKKLGQFAIVNKKGKPERIEPTEINIK